MATGNVYHVVLAWHVDESDKLVSSGFYIRQDGVSFDAAGVHVIAQDLWARIKDRYAATTQLKKSAIRRVYPLEAVEDIDDTDVAGTSAADGISPQVSVVVSLRTPFIGRPYRGRMYLPAPAEDQEDASQILSEAAAADIADAVDTMKTDLAAIGQLTPMVTFSHREKNPDPPPSTIERDPPLIAEVSSFWIDRRMRTQRRRQNRSNLYVGP